jgi:hypothetical protein
MLGTHSPAGSTTCKRGDFAGIGARFDFRHHIQCPPHVFVFEGI